MATDERFGGVTVPYYSHIVDSITYQILERLNVVICSDVEDDELAHFSITCACRY